MCIRDRNVNNGRCFCSISIPKNSRITSNFFWLRICSINNSCRVSHSKEGKVILLWWGHRLWFFPIFWVLHVHEIDSFMPNSSVFIFLMLRALYGSISENLLFLNEFWLFLTFSSLFWVIISNKSSKTYIFALNQRLKTKKHQKTPKIVEKKIESSFTFVTFKLFFSFFHFFQFLQIIL